MVADRYYVWTYRVFAVVSAVVLVSGVLLIFWYRPEPTALFDGATPADIGITFSGSLRQAHQWSVIVWILFAVLLLVVEVARRSIRGSAQLSTVIVLSLIHI